jgi:outer membrane protein OmpA-like peptidoglycan-associated protein
MTRAHCALALLIVLAGCAAPPASPPPPPPVRSYLALLPNDDGTTGKVVFEGAQGTTVLEQPRAAVALAGGATPFQIDEARLQSDAGAAILARPKPPRSFQLYFDAGETRINKASEAQLPEILDEVRNRPAPDISVIGHTDTVGNAGMNERLSLQRAQEVSQLLRSIASMAVNIEVTSHGERNLLVPTPDNTDEPRNRRVEITIR